ncbi:hypothetical protein MSSIT_2251 [Methanosarcina siciliae T4/M]|uniref:Uncharacterized protein n=1 Tax=Methanosarcina siciliae T4/M TaxID=1434120 RepID=A0A0E3P5J9_9EURY|nr:hypothetical protein MSSIT_2251 [Methanosarcina siciliae T4/M]
MASAKMSDVLEYVRECPEEQCPEKFCRFFEGNRRRVTGPKRG